MPRAFNNEYPPESWSQSGLEAALRNEPRVLPVVQYSDSETWEALANDEMTRPAIENVCSKAAHEMTKTPSTFSATDFTKWHREDVTEGERDWNEALNDRLRRLCLFVMAECVEREGEYIDAILDDAWELCNLSTWSYPYELEHADEQLQHGLPIDVPPENRYIGLASSSVARRLAETIHIIGDQLNPTLRTRVRAEVDYHVLVPFTVRDDLWWMSPPGHNINAVCNCRVAAAALYLESDSARLSKLLLKAVQNLHHYLTGFDTDGCWPEGIGYWSYGFGNYVMLAHHLETRLNGRYSLLSPPIIEEIAQFPLRIELSPGHFVPFSDSEEAHNLSPFILCWLGNRLDLHGLAGRGRKEFLDRYPHSAPTGKGPIAVRDVSDEWTVPEPPLRNYFSGYEWWITRADPGNPDTVAVAAKAGTNDQTHNHNDGGSFVVHFCGESLLTDLGSGAYDGDYFDDKRYQYIAARSLGHSVPYVNGFEQRAGEEYTGEVLDRVATAVRDSLSLELSGYYPDDAGLESLQRGIELDRTDDPVSVSITDEATFRADAPDTCIESVLISKRPFIETDDGLLVEGDRARLHIPVPTEATIEHIDHRRSEDESYSQTGEKPIDAWRARIPMPDVDARRASLHLALKLEQSDEEDPS